MDISCNLGHPECFRHVEYFFEILHFASIVNVDLLPEIGIPKIRPFVGIQITVKS